jgi:hypothetical protein
MVRFDGLKANLVFFAGIAAIITILLTREEIS